MAEIIQAGETSSAAEQGDQTGEATDARKRP
jgi:hypothetical protein